MRGQQNIKKNYKLWTEMSSWHTRRNVCSWYNTLPLKTTSNQGQGTLLQELKFV